MGGKISANMAAALTPTVTSVTPPTVKVLNLPPDFAFSGDPIIVVNGYRAKIDLPSKTRVLLWKDDTVELYAKADIVTPDKRSQWFSEFMIASKGREEVHMAVGSLQGNGRKKANDELNDISLIVDNHRVAKPGKYPIVNGAAVVSVIVKTENQNAKDIVKVKSKSLEIAVVTEVAKKFL